MLSCTPDLPTAARFAVGREAMLFLVAANEPSVVHAAAQRGAALDFFSCLPHEREVCFPPCTYTSSRRAARSASSCRAICVASSSR